MGIRRFGGPGMHGLGGVPLSSLGGGSLKTYVDKVRGYEPTAYWPLWEASGTTAQCLTNSAMNGTYNSDVSGWPPGTGIGDGNTAPYFDGTNDVVNILTAALQAAFNGSEGTMAIWMNPDVTTFGDATVRRVYRFRVDANNDVVFAKNGNTYQHQVDYVAGGVSELDVPGDAGNWHHMAAAWSKAAEEIRYFWDGAYVDNDINLGVWAGALAIATIGAANLTPIQQYKGWLAHAVYWNSQVADSVIGNIGRL